VARQHFQQPNLSFGLSIPSFAGPQDFSLENVTIDRFFDDNRCLHVDSYAVDKTLGHTSFRDCALSCLIELEGDMETPVLASLIAGGFAMIVALVGVVLNLLLRKKVGEIDSLKNRRQNRLDRGFESAERLMTKLADLDHALIGLTLYLRTTGGKIDANQFRNYMTPIISHAEEARKYSFVAALYWGNEIVESCSDLPGRLRQMSFSDDNNEGHPQNLQKQVEELIRSLGKKMVEEYLR